MDLNLTLANIPNAEKVALFDNFVRQNWGKGVEVGRVIEPVKEIHYTNGVDIETKTSKFYIFSIASDTDDFLQAIYNLPRQV